MVILWITNPKTREDIPVEIFESSEDALERKDALRLEHPDIIFFYSVNGLEIEADELRSMEDVIEEIRADVQD